MLEKHPYFELSRFPAHCLAGIVAKKVLIMQKEIDCPACGAPLLISGDSTEVQCAFCGALLHISEEDGLAHFQVLGQPGPQKEALSKSKDELENLMGGAQIFPAESQSFSVDQQPAAMPAPPPAPFVPGNPYQMGPGSSAVYPAATPGKSSGSNRWIWIALAALIGLVLFCSCGLVLALFVMNRVR
jgi:LSD1 subclass zinc finger protein